MLKYQTEMMNAGMPVASASMPMPSYGKEMVCNKEDEVFSIAFAAWNPLSSVRVKRSSKGEA
jgi:hypothetical protein